MRGLSGAAPSTSLGISAAGSRASPSTRLMNSLSESMSSAQDDKGLRCSR